MFCYPNSIDEKTQGMRVHNLRYKSMMMQYNEKRSYKTYSFRSITEKPALPAGGISICKDSG